MATEEYFQGDFIGQENPSLQNWKSISAAVSESDSECPKGFDCNICLELVQDPVITLCGHLYCWPCIYKWLYFQRNSNENPAQEEEQKQYCPVCKAEVSHSTLVPLYGRGETKEPSEGKPRNLDIVIPRRPLSPACSIGSLLTTSSRSDLRPAPQLPRRHYVNRPQPYYPHLGSFEENSSPMLGFGGSLMAGNSHQLSGMFGEIMYARMFGDSSNLYSYPNSYHMAGNSNLRVRRQLRRADKSLGRIFFFLCCTVVLCLLLF